MKLTLRPYQKQSIELVREGFRTHLRQLLVISTGGGKTVIFSEIVFAASQKGTKVLVLTDRQELHKQTIEAVKGYGVDICQIDRDSKRIDLNATVYIGMVETFKRRIAQFKDIPFGLIIADEAHVGNFNKVFEAFPSVRVIGATATPKAKFLHKYYTNIVQPIDTPELIDNGWLSPCRAYQMQDDFSDLETKRGEYTDSSLFDHFSNRKLYSGVIDQWRKLAEGKKTLVFNVNIEHTIEMSNQFNECGIHSEYITSKTNKDDRRRILKAFKDGLFPVLNNCGILTKGFNDPSIECIVMNRKTKSLPLFLQIPGRGSRIFPGKSEFLFLDFGMNHDEHGMWDEARTWTLEEKKKKKIQAAPVKDCPKCDAMLHASVMLCKYCGHIFEKKEEEEHEGVMVEVKSTTPEHLIGTKIGDSTVDDLIALQKLKKYKATYIWRIVRSKGEAVLEEYASKMEYKSGWLKRQIENIEDSAFNNYNIR